MRTAKQIEGEKCPKCGSTVGQCRNGKSADGRQRCKCKVCNSYYTINAIQRAYSEDIRNQAIKAYYSGLSGRKVGQLFGMSKANVYNWIKKNEQGVDKSED